MTATKKDDHRVRVARQRRDRTRELLLKTVMASYARGLQQGPPSVDEVVSEADVSRATFYKYFNSVEAVIAELGRKLVDEMVQSLIDLYGDKNDAFFRLTTGIQLFLFRSVIDPVWAAFVARTDYLAQDTEPLHGMIGHLGASRAQGFVAFEDAEAAASLAVGAMMEAMRFMVRTGHRSRRYVEDLNIMILRGLGVELETAQHIVNERTIFIRGVAHDRLAWWVDPWA